MVACFNCESCLCRALHSRDTENVTYTLCRHIMAAACTKLKKIYSISHTALRLLCKEDSGIMLKGYGLFFCNIGKPCNDIINGNTSEIESLTA